MAQVNPHGAVGFLGTPGITSGPDIETMFMALGFERTQLLDGVVGSHSEDMKKRNDQISKMNEALQSVRAHSAKGEGFEIAANSSEIKLFKEMGVPLPKDVQKQLDEGKIPLKFSKEEAQAMTENIKTGIDNLSWSSQLDMIKLQGLINKRNQGIEMLTNLMQKFQQTNNTIIGNMR
jgi:hypothetical protein